MGKAKSADGGVIAQRLVNGGHWLMSSNRLTSCPQKATIESSHLRHEVLTYPLPCRSLISRAVLTNDVQVRCRAKIKIAMLATFGCYSSKKRSAADVL